MDDYITNLMQEHHNEILDHIFSHVVHLGSYSVITILIVFTVGFLCENREYQKSAVFFAFLFVASVFVEGLKTLSGRGKCLVNDEGFPLGFCIITMTVYLVIAQVLNIGHRTYLICFAIGTSVLVGIAKIYIGLNYFSDVVIGWIIGILIAVIFHFINKNLEKHSPLMRRSTDARIKEPDGLINPMDSITFHQNHSI